MCFMFQRQNSDVVFDQAAMFYSCVDVWGGLVQPVLVFVGNLADVCSNFVLASSCLKSVSCLLISTLFQEFAACYNMQQQPRSSQLINNALCAV